MASALRLPHRRAGVFGRISALVVASLVLTLGGVGALSAQAIPVTPTVTSISPDHGSLDGGTLVTVNGTGFTASSTVRFSATTAPSVTFVSSTQLTVLSPVSSGTVDVIVTTAGVPSATSSADVFNYYATPVVTGISPTSGSGAGGTTVSITGSGFVNATTVNFGSSSVPIATHTNDELITAVSPAGADTVDVTVTSPGGTSAVVPADAFTYAAVPPAITSISPASGPAGGGNTVVIHGVGFVGVTSVTFGTRNAGITVNSSTMMTVTPLMGTGTVDVTVSTPLGDSAHTSADQYTFLLPPNVTGISPSSGPESGGTSVTITGNNFIDVANVKFGASLASYVVDSPTQITATAPSGSGTVDVRVTTAGGPTNTSGADQFTYLPAPTVTGLSPVDGDATVSTVVTITGTNLTNATAVHFGTTSVAFTVDSDTQITATAPPSVTGTVDVTVTTPGGTSATSSDDEFDYLGPATITSVTPDIGPESGLVHVTITGTGFEHANAVEFGSTLVSFHASSDTEMIAEPLSGTGTVSITIFTGGFSFTGSQYTFAPVPSVTSISPTTGVTPGGTTVTIHGTGFLGAPTVTFGAIDATDVTVVDAATITATAPAGSLGTVDVTVTTPGGTSATSPADQFTYVLPPPTVTGISPSSGSTAGGTVVTITGTRFTGATSVNFGGTAASTFTVDSPTQITATAPANTALTRDVTVTTPDGTSATSSADEFTSVAATLNLSSTSADIGGGITVSGSGFAPNTSLDIVLHSTPATLATVTSSAAGAFSATVTIPAGTAPGAHTIVVGGASIALTVVDPAAALASTGSDPSDPLGIAAALLGIGLLLTAAGVRRRRASRTA